jgi:hypothetical protein
MLPMLGLLGGVCLIVIGLMIAVSGVQGMRVGEPCSLGVCVTATGLTAYGVVLVATGVWLMLWAAGFA